MVARYYYYRVPELLALGALAAAATNHLRVVSSVVSAFECASSASTAAAAGGGGGRTSSPRTPLLGVVGVDHPRSSTTPSRGKPATGGRSRVVALSFASAGGGAGGAGGAGGEGRQPPPAMIGGSAAAATTTTTKTKASKPRRVLGLLGLRGDDDDSASSAGGGDGDVASSIAESSSSSGGEEEEEGVLAGGGGEGDVGPFEVSTISELNDYFDDVKRRFRRGGGRGGGGCRIRHRRRRRSRGGGDGGDDGGGDADDGGGGGRIDHSSLLASLSVRGDTQVIGSIDRKDVVHPVVRLLHDRRRRIEAERQRAAAAAPEDPSSSANDDDARRRRQPTFRNSRGVRRTLPLPDDGYRVALAIEGGGMRGCVTAGMAAAVHHLGLSDSIDVVYGSSAGTVIGAYFVTRQLPWFGPELYYDALTTAGDGFINAKRFLRAVGLGLLDPRLAKDVIFRRNHGKPVLDLTYLLNTTMQTNKPLDWETFEEMQKVQPLKVMASGLKSLRAFVMDMERGSFSNVEELACCMRASCLLPGVAGPVINMRYPREEGGGEDGGGGRRGGGYGMIPRNNFGGGDDYEPLADALLFEPLPYRSAIREGATHVVCLRSRPDGVDVTGKSSIFERMVVRRFLLRKNSLGGAYEYMKRHLHKKLYAAQVIELNEGARDVYRPYSDTSRPHLLPIAVPPGSAEIPKLETGRDAIFRGVRRGFARAYDALVEDPEQRGRGAEIAELVFPDEILDYDPLVYTSRTESAYEVYLKSKKKKDD